VRRVRRVRERGGWRGRRSEGRRSDSVACPYAIRHDVGGKPMPISFPNQKWAPKESRRGGKRAGGGMGANKKGLWMEVVEVVGGSGGSGGGAVRKLGVLWMMRGVCGGVVVVVVVVSLLYLPAFLFFFHLAPLRQ